MKSILIAVFLLAAAGGSAYFFLHQNKNYRSHSSAKEMILGKWFVDSLDIKNRDSSMNLRIGMGLHGNLAGLEFDFQRDGKIFYSTHGTAKPDTMQYEWVNDHEFSWKNHVSDSLGTKIAVVKLDTVSLVVQLPDSVSLYFKKLH